MPILRKALREPLLHFFLLGAALFVLFGYSNGATGPGENRIVVTQGRIEHLVATFEGTWRRPPSQDELDDLIDGFIRDEIYYREALALGLDKDDTVVRQRMRQKLAFLTAATGEALEPTEEELREYLEAHPETFRTEPRTAFLHIYLNPERHPGSVHAVAMDMLTRLGTSDLPPGGHAALGDRLMLPTELPLSRHGEIERLFGRRFADGVWQVQAGRWTGPIESGYGQHLVYVTERSRAHLPTLAEIREDVVREWLDDRQEALAERFYRNLRQRYSVEVRRPEAGMDAGGAVDAVADAR